MSNLLPIYIHIIKWVFLLALIFYPFELLAPAERGQPFRKRVFNLVYAALYLALVLFVLSPVVSLLTAQVLALSAGGLLPQLAGPGSSFIAQLSFAIVFAVFLDFCQYWQHRWQHTVPLLWQTHRFHHSETATNATTQGRHLFLQYFLATIFYLPVLVIFGTQAPHYIALFLISMLWGFVNHANVRLNLGPLTPIISGPQWHRIHHSNLDEHQDKNFASFFPFIDILFGTYYRPQPGEYPPSGLSAKDEKPALSEATFVPFLNWAKRAPGSVKKGASLLTGSKETETL
jgi:sterol desaturase/sphingolipid hydroxylase (fatty acid hydroxylase superfamily)